MKQLFSFFRTFFCQLVSQPKQLILSPAKVTITWHPGLSFNFFLLVLFFLTTGVYGQISTVNPPSGGFQVDGDLKANTPTANIGDWVSGAGGTGGAIFGNTGLSLWGDKARLVRDPYNDNTDIIFSSGSKFMDAPEAWSWSDGKPPAKNDIHNAMYLVTRDATDDWLMIGSDRLAINGTSYIDFELLQNTVTRNTTNNKFTSTGTQGGRTVNDLVISMEYSNGGSKPNVIIYQWKETSPGVFGYVSIPLNTLVGGQPLSNYVYAETNRNGAAEVPFGAFGSTSYPQYSFVEAAVNMTKVIGALGNPCLGLSIKTIFIKTKASDSPTAALKDVIEPIPVSITFGNASISYGGPYCPVGTASVVFGEGSVLGGSFSALPAGLSLNPTTGAINLATSAPGNYTVTYSFTQGACTKTVTAPVVVKALSGAPGTAPVSYCVGDVATPLTATGTNLLWYTTAIGGTGSSTAPTPSTASAGPNTYYVSQTESGKCEGPRAALVVTVNPNPTGTNTSMISCPSNIGGTTAVFDLTTKNATVTGGVIGVTVVGWYETYSGGVFSNPIASPATYTSGSKTVYAKLSGTGNCIGVANNGLTVNPSEGAPNVRYIAPECYETTFKVQVLGPVAGVKYKITNSNGDNPAEIIATSVAGVVQEVIFINRTAGSGYSVTATVGNCISEANTCGPPSANRIQLAPLTSKAPGTNDQVEKSDITAYPIPFSDRTTIEFKSIMDEDFVVNLYDLKGTLIKQLKSGKAKAGDITRIEVDGSGMAESMYLARKVSKSGATTIKLLKKK